MDYSTLERDSGGGSKKVIRSVDASMNSLDADDYIMEDSMKKVTVAVTCGELYPLAMPEIICASNVVKVCLWVGIGVS